VFIERIGEEDEDLETSIFSVAGIFCDTLLVECCGMLSEYGGGRTLLKCIEALGGELF
jgi:hypothetical protein